MSWTSCPKIDSEVFPTLHQSTFNNKVSCVEKIKALLNCRVVKVQGNLKLILSGNARKSAPGLGSPVWRVPQNNSSVRRGRSYELAIGFHPCWTIIIIRWYVDLLTWCWLPSRRTSSLPMRWTCSAPGSCKMSTQSDSPKSSGWRHHFRKVREVQVRERLFWKSQLWPEVWAVRPRPLSVGRCPELSPQHSKEKSSFK